MCGSDKISKESGSTDGEALKRFLEALEKQQPAVLITVTETSGSTPRKPGAKMFLTPETQYGSIGGSAIEKAAVDRGRDLLASGGEAEARRYDLKKDLGMACGGSMSVFFEPVQSVPRLIIFGAGHVAQPLCTLASLAGFSVTVCDTREEWLREDRFPRAGRLVPEEPETAIKTLAIDPRTFIVVVTHSHAIDFGIVERLLELPSQPPYVGVIGSRRKGEELIRKLQAAGFDQARIETVHIPVGMNIGAITPEEIAVSVAAELVAVRRGVKTISSW